MLSCFPLKFTVCSQGSKTGWPSLWLSPLGCHGVNTLILGDFLLKDYQVIGFVAKVS